MGRRRESGAEERFRKRSKTAGDTHGRAEHTVQTIPERWFPAECNVAGCSSLRRRVQRGQTIAATLTAERKRQGRTAGERRGCGRGSQEGGRGALRCVCMHAPMIRVYHSRRHRARISHERRSGRRNKDGGP